MSSSHGNILDRFLHALKLTVVLGKLFRTGFILTLHNALFPQASPKIVSKKWLLYPCALLVCC